MIDLARAREVLEAGRTGRVFPCAVAEVGRRGGALATVSVGSLTYDAGSPAASASTVFDLASLTKVLAGSTLAMMLLERGRLPLDMPVSEWLPAFDCHDRRDVRVRDLLEHCSGLPGHRPYYRDVRGRRAFEIAITREPLEYVPRTRAVYSDLGFMLLGFILEDAGGLPLDAAFDRWREAALGEDVLLRYGPLRSEGVAPTECDPWRNRLLTGEVHDENAWALGGVAAHAGLFGTAAAVGAAARWWLGVLGGEPSEGISRETAALFARKSTVPGSSRALGWDTMLPTSSCGEHMSARAIGHTGFTGTSLWLDPFRDLYVVLLTNRVHPSREGTGIAEIRRAFHDAVMLASEADA